MDFSQTWRFQKTPLSRLVLLFWLQETDPRASSSVGTLVHRVSKPGAVGNVLNVVNPAPADRTFILVVNNKNMRVRLKSMQNTFFYVTPGFFRKKILLMRKVLLGNVTKRVVELGFHSEKRLYWYCSRRCVIWGFSFPMSLPCFPVECDHFCHIYLSET